MDQKCSFIDRLRGPKIFNMAIFDWVCTIIAAWIIAAAYSDNTLKSFVYILIILVILAILVHKIFNIPTMLNYYLGLNTKDAVLQNRKDC